MYNSVRYTILSLALFITTISVSTAQLLDNSLFKITQNNKIGFIDIDGNIVIPPKFIQAGNFSNQLAEARIKGLYGYINKKGAFEIKPQFEFALPFNEERAVVYQDARPLVIDKKGKIIIDNPNFAHISNFENNLALITTSTGKKGFVDTKGDLVIDTVFSSVRNFEDGLAIVYGISPKNEETTSKIGVIDKNGKFIVPYGKYTDINSFNEGYAIAEKEEGENSKKIILNKKGKVVFEYIEKNHISMGDYVNSGVIKMSMYKHMKKENTGVSFTTEKKYIGYMDLNGNIFIDDIQHKYGEEYSENRTFVSKGSSYHKYYILNEKGERVTDEVFAKVANEGFKNGFAVVEKNARWGIIDREGKFVVEPIFNEINTEVEDALFLFTGGKKDGEFDFSFLKETYGIANTKGEIILKPILKEFDRRGFVNGLLLGSLDKEGKEMVYINKQGKIVWKSSQTEKIVNLNLEYFNIDYMNRGYFYANSNETEGIGGWGGSDNYSEKDVLIDIKSKKTNPTDSILVFIDTDRVIPIAGKYKGRYVFISNVSDKGITFDAQDSRLYAKMQAINKKGEWQDIEYLPSSWCGNSYHTMTLKSNHTWKFLTPIYEGNFKTQLRVALIIKNNHRDESKSIIQYSKPVYGSINLSQFWRKPSYSPQGLMDPYFD
ncbi:WG repeat-containing protein [Bernardetia sp. ABR2-2B]|uniref:WG repeat-containing protein n=1 Tax=Bernardetia sp. ABR2-2B TaxID=3127472 RepID=UPI0030CB5BF0